MSIEDLERTIENDYAVYRFSDTKVVIFKYHIPTLESFKLTQEEKVRSIKLCLEARLNGNWTGDILRGPYENN